MNFLCTVTLITLLNGLAYWATNLPQDAGEDVPAGRLNSLSYAPFREHQGPLQGIFPTVPQLDQDLHLLGGKTRSIRTYTSAEGSMSEIPALARKHGLSLTQGAWLGSLAKGNDEEIKAVIASAKANPDVVKRVIVGNEVLLRGDLTPEQLIQYIRQVKQAVEQPVSYADVWSMYMKYPKLIQEVDYITIHILPYWEDQPIAVDQAPAHIQNIYQKVREEADRIAPGKAILIGEAGWPSAGRQRGFAVPSVVNAATFTRSLIQVAQANGFDVNIVEAFNQPWKSQLEGVVGANWGLFSSHRQEVFPLTGRVYENPDWYKNLGLSSLLFLVAAAVFRKPLRALAPLQTAALLLSMQLMLALWAGQSEFLWSTSYSVWQRLASVFIVGLNAAIGGLIIWQGYLLLIKQAGFARLATASYALYLAFAAYAVFETLSLAFNGRYISFPNWATCIPVIGVITFLLLSGLSQHTWRQGLAGLNGQLLSVDRWQTYRRSLGFLLLGSGLMLVLGETHAFFISRDTVADYPQVGQRLGLAVKFTLGNQQLVLWLMSLTILSMPFLAYRPTPTTQP